MKKTFFGGIHPLKNKHEGKNLTKDSNIIKISVPETVVIPVSQHTGGAAAPCVEVGDTVKMGQVIAKENGFVSVPVHASVSGKVIKIEEMQMLTGKSVCITIENDGLDTLHEAVKPCENPFELNKEQIIEKIKNAGIVGLGGAAFPLHVKLSPPKDKPIDTIILNAAECEPYLTVDYRTILERANEVLSGFKLCRKAVGAKRAIIGIEDNKPEAVKILADLCKQEEIDLMVLKTKYPQGGEKQLIKTCIKREIPSGKLPFDIGVVVCNVGTCAAVYDALYLGKPLFESTLTVTGAVKNPANISARVGTSFEYCIEQCGGVSGETVKVVSGGPMMGIAVKSLDIPVVKATSGILVFDSEMAKEHIQKDCIRCGKCIRTCPMKLQPVFLNICSINNKFDEAQNLNALDCIECGCCSYICPSKRYLLPSIRVAKSEIIEKRKKEGGK